MGEDHRWPPPYRQETARQAGYDADINRNTEKIQTPKQTQNAFTRMLAVARV
jgi:hypothetical protein